LKGKDIGSKGKEAGGGEYRVLKGCKPLLQRGGMAEKITQLRSIGKKIESTVNQSQYPLSAGKGVKRKKHKRGGRKKRNDL